MNVRKLLLFATLSLPLSLWGADRPVKVVTTTPDLADITRRIGGDGVTVLSLASGAQNPHHVEAKPSLIVKLMDADLFIQTGFELEQGWAPLLLQSSRNKKILPGAPGFLEASEAVTPLEVPMNPSRAMGDVHPQGNPHFMTDPSNGLKVARLIATRLASLAPAQKAVIDQNLAAFEKELQQNIAAWDALMKPLKGAKFVSYHRDWTYFAARYGLESSGEIEPKPGIPPTAVHTAELIEKMKAEKVRIILNDPWYEARTAEFIARATGARVYPLALLPGGTPGTDTYIKTIDANVKALASGGQP